MSAPSELRSALRAMVPFTVWQMAGFLTRVPSYWRVDRSNALRVRNGVEGRPLYVTRDVHVFAPESITAYLNWQYHGVEVNEASAEATDFLELSNGRTALIDVGAQTGFMSALFARSRSRPCHILSVEPDPAVRPILERAVELNRGDDTDWKIVATAISNTCGRLVMVVPESNRLYERAAGMAQASDIDVPVTTLVDLLAGLAWQPDIIKIDVESFEHEILVSSLGVLEKIKPALQLEVHWQMLARRGRNASDFLAPLASLGYRGIRSSYRDLNKWLRAGRSEPVSRLALRAV